MRRAHLWCCSYPVGDFDPEETVPISRATSATAAAMIVTAASGTPTNSGTAFTIRGSEVQGPAAHSNRKPRHPLLPLVDAGRNERQPGLRVLDPSNLPYVRWGPLQ